jgi:hypothetical protein
MTPRAISSQELDVIRRALQVCRTGDALPVHNAVAGELVVASLCGCGCDTVEFKRTGSEVAAVIADGLGDTPDGKGVGVIVFGTPKTITCLEVYSFDDAPARLPILDSIRPFGCGN